MKLYEISELLRTQLDAIANEDLDPQQAAQKLQHLSGEFKEKIAAVVGYAQELSALATMRKDAAKRLIDGAKALESKAESLLDYAQINIQNISYPVPMRLPQFTVNLAKMPPKSLVFNDAQVPTSYRTRTLTFIIRHDVSVEQVNEAVATLTPLCSDTGYDDVIRKADLLADLKEGVIVPGAKLEPLAYRLTVK